MDKITFLTQFFGISISILVLYTNWQSGSVKTPILTLAMDHTNDLRDTDRQTVLLTASCQEEAEELSFRFHGICGSLILAYPGGHLATSCNNELS